MANETNLKKGFWQKIRNLYRFQVIDINTYDVRWVVEMSKLNLIVLLGGLLFLMLLLAFAVFALTPLRYVLPGYVGSNAEEKRAIIALRLKSEELEKKVKQNDAYYANLSALLEDHQELHNDYKEDQQMLLKADSAYFFPQPGKLETRFRKDFETLLKEDLGTDKTGKVFVLNSMVKPVEGKPVPLEEQDIHSRTLRIRAREEAAVTSVLPGLVIAKYKSGDQVHIFIQHDDYLVSSYKFPGVADVMQGERVEAGQLIGSIQKASEGILSLDIWANAEPIPPGQYLKY